jgi:hypothetical protein
VPLRLREEVSSAAVSGTAAMTAQSAPITFGPKG